MNVISRRVIRLIIIAVSAVLVVNLSRSIWDLWRRRDILGERQAVLERLQEENKRLQTELEEAQSQEFIEKEARNRLGLAREGEEVILMPNLPAGKAGDEFQMSNGKTETTVAENLPKWKRWWRLFF